MTTLFISDIHLSMHEPEGIERFCQFLAREARTADTLYILGDLFDVWTTDLEIAHPAYQKVVNALKELTSQHTPTFLMHGNRDFMLGMRFMRSSGCQFLKDPTVIQLYGIDILLVHGDSLCTDDKIYQVYRKFIRNPVITFVYRCFPLFMRNAIAKFIRWTSKSQTKHKEKHLLDVNADAVTSQLNKFNVHQMIHGHTHLPSIELHPNDNAWRRIVLSDWHEQGNMLLVNSAQDARLVYFK